ncbi:MAG: hypothetical protein IJT16_13815 [Lachnospiraceae bacterium]|nr:hypothetical protein [Lachnospiraceae bacterium]
MWTVEKNRKSVKLLSGLLAVMLLVTGMMPPARISAAVPSIVQLSSTYTYAEMCQDIAELTQTYPGIVTSGAIGTSVLGNPIPLVILGNPAAPRSIMVQSSIHGREYIVSQTTMATIEYYASRYAAGEYGDVLASTCFYIVPMVNPDGVTMAQMMNPSWKANANGVDLNRNFPTLWELTKGASAPGAANFKGYLPGSEPETQALMNLAVSRDYCCYLNYHQQGNIIYYDDDLTSPVVSQLSAALARTVSAINGYRPVNTAGSNASGTTTYGGFGDFTLIGIQKPGITVECGSAYGAAAQGQAASIYLKNVETWAAVARLFPS